MKDKKRQGTMFKKIFSLICITVILMAAINIGGVLFLRNQIREVGLREQSNYIDAYASSIDNVFRDATNLIVQLENSSALMRIAKPGYRESPEYLSNENEIFHMFSTLYKVSDSIRDVFLITNPEEKCYTSSGYVTPNIYFKNRYVGNYPDWLNTLTAAYNKPTVVKFNLEKTIDDQHMVVRYPSSTIYALKTMRFDYSAGFNGTLCVCIDESVVESIFANNKFAEKRRIYVCNANNDIIASNSDESLVSLIASSPENLLSDGGDYILSGKGLLSCRVSPEFGLRYFVYTPFAVLTGSYDGLIMAFIGISIFLMLVLIFFGYLSTQKVYRPVQSIIELLHSRQKNPEWKVKNETEFIQQHIKEIISSNSDLRSTMAETSPLMIEMILFKILRGSVNISETLESTAKPYGINFENEGMYSTLVIRMELQADSDEQFELRYDQRFRDIIRSAIDRWLVSIVETRQDEYAIVMFCNSEADCEQLRNQFGVMYEELSHEIPNSSFMMGFGGYVDQVMNLRRSYLNALNAIRHRRIHDGNIVLEWKDEEIVPYYLPADFEADLTNMLRAEHYDLARNFISGQFELNNKNNICVMEYLQMCYLINGLLLRFIRSKNSVLARDTISIDPHTSLYSTQRLNEIVYFNLSLLVKYSQSPTSAQESVLELVIRYVNEHFTEDINLMVVSNDLGYTSNYISRLFKQAKGMKFTDYLSLKRVNYAKTLLAESNTTTIKQIAQRAGFNSSTLLIRTFERFEGVTPGEYRKNCK